jgi:hypothetical protein
VPIPTEPELRIKVPAIFMLPIVVVLIVVDVPWKET